MNNICRAIMASIMLGFFLSPLSAFAQENKQNDQSGQATSVTDEMFANLPGFQQKDQANEMVARPSRFADSQQPQASLELPGSAQPMQSGQSMQPDQNALDVEGVRHMKTVEVVGEGERYTLGPEDVVQIMVRNQPDFSGYFVVGPEGHIQYNWCGDIKAEGLTKEELKALLTEKLAEYVRYPEVSVAIVEYNSKAVYIVGSVNNPGKYPMKGDHIELRDALVLAGLPTDTSALSRAKIVRETEDGPVDIQVNLKDLLYKGQMDKNFELLPGDIVYVPMSRFVKTTDVMSQTLGPVFQAAAVYSIANDVMGSDD
jgi:polysaccharide export outer membrane protein